jgi:hypothetical protein
MNVAFREPNESTPVLDSIAEALLLPSESMASTPAPPRSRTPWPGSRR